MALNKNAGALTQVIEQAMRTFPQQRLGQIIANALNSSNFGVSATLDDLFYTEDEVLYKALKDYIALKGNPT